MILPLKNRVDVESLSDDVKQELEIVYVNNIDEIVDLVLVKE